MSELLNKTVPELKQMLETVQNELQGLIIHDPEGNQERIQVLKARTGQVKKALDKKLSSGQTPESQTTDTPIVKEKTHKGTRVDFPKIIKWAGILLVIYVAYRILFAPGKPKAKPV